ncbi:MAG TPA: GNAT family N-acetyltransferase [Gammaproteobacteria bacterium]|nr:GNAT family N-acetyltransferase [Gammaproteobacteria bacterium]
MKVRRFGEASAFLDRAESWLLREEAENGLFLGVATSLLGPHRFRAPIYLATVEDRGRIVGCAFRTPPYHPVITRLPLECVAGLVADFGRVYGTLPGVQGPTSEAEAFAAAWCRRTGRRGVVGFRLKLHVLTEVTRPVPVAPGWLRAAVESDLELAARWAVGFVRDTGVDTSPEEFGEHLLRAGALYLWDDEAPRCMVAVNRTSMNGATIGAVYTPPEFRGRGYASAAVAELSQRLLDAGRRFCTLYADLANPTSNKIYRAVGFRPRTEVVLLRFA